jgi:hypothetical protein
MDPWTVDDMVAKSALQKIWNAIFGEDIPHKVTVDGPVFAVVSITLLSEKSATYICIHLQAQQRVSDTWRTVIGSTGLSVVNTFFESKEDLKTDEARKQVAQEGLEHLKFLYSNTNSDDPLVSLISYIEGTLILVSAIQRRILWSARPPHLCGSLQCYSRCHQGARFASC